MIESFRHKGLHKLYAKGDRSRVAADYADKLERILARLDQAETPLDMDLPGYRLHPLRGDLKDFWSVTVSGNWRVIFRFVEANAHDVDLTDYH
jgi:proteic killer suppression protein